MRHRIILIVLIAGLFAGWAPTQKVMWGVYTVAWAVDLGQTHYIANHPDEYYEDVSAWAIGEHPSVGQVNNYFAASYLLNYFIANNFNSGWRNVYISFPIMGHALCIKNNKSIGIKVEFSL